MSTDDYFGAPAHIYPSRTPMTAANHPTPAGSVSSMGGEGAYGGDAKSLSLAVQAKLHGFQSILDNHVHMLKQLRREVDGKQEAAEAVRAAEAVSSMSGRVRELERALDGKAGVEEVAARLEEVLGSLAKTMDAAEINLRFSRCPTKAEMQAELGSKVSSSEVKNWMAVKADASEVDGMLERQNQAIQAMQVQVDSAVSSEMEGRRQAMLVLRETMLQEMNNMRTTMEQRFAKNLDDAKYSMEVNFQAKLEAAMARDAKARQQDMSALHESIKAELFACEKALHAEITQEVSKRGANEGSMRELMKEMHDSVMGEVKLMVQGRVTNEDLAALQEEVAETLTKKVDHSEFELVMGRLPNKTEIQAELSKKPSMGEVQSFMESKADRADVKAFFERQVQAWQSVQEKVDTGLAAEAEARRKGDAGAREMIVQELDTIKMELVQRNDMENTNLKLEMKHVRDSVETEVAIECKARQQALEALRKSLHEEVRAVEKSVETSLHQEHQMFREFEGLLPRIERQVATLKEEFKSEQDARGSLQAQLHGGLDAIGQELQELQSDATRSEKRLRADVDHTIQQLTAEMREEREERLAREAEHTSCTSQLQVQVDELGAVAGRTKLVAEDLETIIADLRNKLEGKANRADVSSQMMQRPTKQEMQAEMEMKISTAQAKSLMDSNAQEVEAALVKQATVLQGLHSQMDRDKARHDEMVKSELLAHKEAVHEEVRALRRDLEAKLEEGESSFKTSTAGIKSMIEESVEGERKARRAAVEAAQKETEVAVRGEGEARKKALGAAIAGMEQELKSVRAEMHQRASAQVESFKQTVEGVSMKFEGHLGRVKTELEDSMSKQQRVLVASVSQARNELEGLMASEHKAQSGVLAVLQGDVDTRLGSETRALRQQIDELQAEITKTFLNEERMRERTFEEMQTDLENKIGLAETNRKQGVEAIMNDLEAKMAAERRAREQAMDGQHAEFTGRFVSEQRAREQVVEQLVEMVDSKTRAVAVGMRSEMEAESETRWQDCKAQILGLDAKLGSLLVEEEIKLRDAMMVNLNKLKEEAKEEQAATQAKMMELRKVVEEKADVEEVTDHLLDIQRAVNSKVDRSDARKAVRRQAKSNEALSAGFSSASVPYLTRRPASSTFKGSKTSNLSYNLLSRASHASR